MPNRILRDGINDSEVVNSLSEEAELFYRRLYTYVDDFGRGSASPRIIRGKVFALRLDEWNEERIQRCLNECVATGLVVHYSVDGKNYLEIQRFGQRLRPGVPSKFPSPNGVHSPNNDDPPPNAASRRAKPQDAARASPSPTPSAPAQASEVLFFSNSENSSSEEVKNARAPAVEGTELVLAENGDTLEKVLADVAAMYRQGGLAVAPGVLQLATNLLLDKPPLTRYRLRNYVAWNFGTGRWPTPQKTKSLWNVLQTGEYDVDLGPRTLPEVIQGVEKKKPQKERVRDLIRARRAKENAE